MFKRSSMSCLLDDGKFKCDSSIALVGLYIGDGGWIFVWVCACAATMEKPAQVCAPHANIEATGISPTHVHTHTHNTNTISYAEHESSSSAQCIRCSLRRWTNTHIYTCTHMRSETSKRFRPIRAQYRGRCSTRQKQTHWMSRTKREWRVNTKRKKHKIKTNKYVKFDTHTFRFQAIFTSFLFAFFVRFSCILVFSLSLSLLLLFHLRRITTRRANAYKRQCFRSGEYCA